MSIGPRYIPCTSHAPELLAACSFAMLVLFHGPLSAQTGPGGVGNATFNVLWLDAGSGTLNGSGSPAVNGNGVRTWTDRSGNSKDASQPTVAARPTLVTGAINGRSTLHFVAASSQCILSTGVSSASTASVWIVANHTSLPSPNPGLLQGAPAGLGFSSATGDKCVGVWVSNTGKLWGRGVQSNGANINLPASTSVPSSTTSIFSSIYGNSLIAQYMNGGSAGSVAYDNTLRSWTDVGIGRQANEAWNGDIAEVIAFNTMVGTTQRHIIDNYLAAKYGLALANGDLYTEDDPASGNYDHDVAGIGRISATDLQTDSRGSGILGISNPTGLGNNEFLLWGHDDGVLGAFGSTDLPLGVQGRWGRTWRFNEVNLSGAAVNVGAVDITFDLAGQGTVNASDLRLLIDTDKDGLFNDETPITGATWIGGTSYRFAAVTAITNRTRLTLGTINMAGTPLPIELVAFTAKVESPGVVRLDWITASEQDNDHFTVLRSTDLALWEEVGQLPGSGNSNATLNYLMMDPSALLGVSYYRLDQTDFNGAMSSSDVVAVSAEAATQVFPNPVSDLLTVITSAVTPFIQLLDMMGNAINVPMTGYGNRHVLDLSNLTVGPYLLVIDDGTLRTAKQVMVQ